MQFRSGRQQLSITAISLTIILVIILASSVYLVRQYTKSSNKSSTQVASENCPNKQTTAYLGLKKIELAQTDAEQQQGLMNRPEICENYGMLFISKNLEYLNFWMKDTPASLDIIFMDSEGKINTIHKNTVPKQTFPTYPSKSISKYTLETKAGFSECQNLKEGDQIDIENLLKIGENYKF